MFRQDFTCPALLWPGVSKLFRYRLCYHLQAGPISLATTLGISVDVFSCSYLDVSVRRVRFA
jgi:hypothetical protein